MADSLYFPTHYGLLTPEHYEKIGPALWEFLWLISKVTKEVKEEGETVGIVLGGRPVKNTEIVEELGTSQRSTERNISRLKQHGYITTKRTPRGNIFTVRKSKKFYKNRTAKKEKNKDSEPPNMAEHKKGEPPNMKSEPPNMVSRTANGGGSNKIKKDKESINNIYVEIISYLNEKAGKRFSPKSNANQKFINGRINEGRTLEDFKHVIDVKTDQWLSDDKMHAYLRPSTLFRPENFENYLNQEIKKKPNQPADPRDVEIARNKWIANGGDPEAFVYKGE